MVLAYGRSYTFIMKKILTLLAIGLAVVNVSNAQLQKGNVLIGGNIADFNLGLNKGGAYNFTIVPKAAWFISDNVAVGGYLNFGLQGAKNGATSTTYGIGPLARYYMGKTDLDMLKHGRWFVEGNVGVGGTNVSDGGPSTNGLDLGVGPGYAYFITPNIGLEGLFKYYGQVGFGNTTSSNNLGLSVGLQIYLPGKSTRDRLMSDERK